MFAPFGIRRTRMIEEAVWCGICHQRPWRTEAGAAMTEVAYVFRAWCHGAYRRWLVGEEIIALQRFDALARALLAFPAMLRALAPVLVQIKRLRGRRLPLPRRDAITVWLR